MRPDTIDRLFNFKFTKTEDEIKQAVSRKTAAIKTKIGQRETRIAKIRAEYDITDTALIDLLSQARNTHDLHMTYLLKNGVPARHQPGDDGVNEVTIGAGVVNNLLTEQDFIEAERAQVRRLELLHRNLTGSRDLSYDELEFLGF